MSGVKIIKIKAEDDGMRLNRWFLREYPALSLGRLQKLLRTKQIKLTASAPRLQRGLLPDKNCAYRRLMNKKP